MPPRKPRASAPVADPPAESPDPAPPADVALEAADDPAEPETPPEQARRPITKIEPPANIGEAALELGVALRYLSVSRGVKNITGTLGFTLDVPHAGELQDLMGEHAYAAVFRGSYLGNGVLLKAAPLGVDEENRVTQTMKVTLPRFDDGADQVASYLAPLVSEPLSIVGLLALEEAFTTTVKLDHRGTLALHAMQESFDLTKRASEDLTDEDEDLLP